MARSYWWHVFLPDGDVFVERGDLPEPLPLYHVARERTADGHVATIARPDQELHVWIGQGDRTFEDFVTASGSVTGQQISEAVSAGAFMAAESEVEQPADYVHFWEFDDRKFYFANDAENPRWFDRPQLLRGSGRESGLWVLWFTNWHPLYVAVWARSLDDALEEAAAFVKDSGLTHPFADEKQMYDDAAKDLIRDEESKPDDPDWEDKVREVAETDMTYTESGWITSDDWGVVFEPQTIPPELREAAERLSALVNGEFYAAEPDDG